MSNDNVISIKEHLFNSEMNEALFELQPALVTIYDVYGLDICLNSMARFIAAGIAFEENLTADERQVKLVNTREAIDKFLAEFLTRKKGE